MCVVGVGVGGGGGGGEKGRRGTSTNYKLTIYIINYLYKSSKYC